MTKILGFGRAIGKTTMAILESYATGYRILASSRREARHIAVTAKQMGYAIPEPLAVYDFENGKMNGTREQAVIVDNVERVLSAFTGLEIQTITFSSPHLQFAEDRYIGEVTELKKELNACYEEKKSDQAEIERLKYLCHKQQETIMNYEWQKMHRSAISKKANRRRYAR
ncbi:hypothetical protein HO415_01305 [Streptococcus suis]|nr:hypothetical protein [Streptococcus suis]